MKKIMRLTFLVASFTLGFNAYADSRHISIKLFDSKYFPDKQSYVYSNQKTKADAILIPDITLPGSQLLVSALSSDGTKLSETVVLNPLLVKAEALDPKKGKMVFHGYVDQKMGNLHVRLPESEEIDELVFYKQVKGKLEEIDRVIVGEPTVEMERKYKDPDVIALMNNGSSNNRSDLVLVAEGYTSSEIHKFRADAQRIVEGYFAESPYKEYKNFFNVWGVKAVSRYTGAGRDGYPNDTAFRSYFGCSGIDRLLCADSNRIDNYVRSKLNTSQVDQILLVVNDKKYGGAGGGIATMSLAPAAVDLALHEVAHSYGLADEYTGGGPSCSHSEPREPNVTSYYGRKWDHWQDLSHINWYEGGNYCDTGIYRPTRVSMMGNLGYPFYEVNSEALIVRAYAYVDPIDAVKPNSKSVKAKGQQRFAVDTVQPIPNTLVQYWYVDGEEVTESRGDESFTLSTTAYDAGRYTVKVIVKDNTEMVRKDDRNVTQDSYTWEVQLSDGGTGPGPGPGECENAETPKTPEGLQAANATSKSITALWSKVKNADAYKVDVWDISNKTGSSYTTNNNALTLSFKSNEIEQYKGGEWAYYRVKAIACKKESGYSDWFHASLTDSNRKTFTGSLSGGDSNNHSTSKGYYVTVKNGVYEGALIGPANKNFDLYLYGWNEGQEKWEVIKSSKGSGSVEKITHKVTATEYLYFKVRSPKDSGDYTLITTQK